MSRRGWEKLWVWDTERGWGVPWNSKLNCTKSLLAQYEMWLDDHVGTPRWLIMCSFAAVPKHWDAPWSSMAEKTTDAQKSNEKDGWTWRTSNYLSVRNFVGPFVVLKSTSSLFWLSLFRITWLWEDCIVGVMEIIQYQIFCCSLLSLSKPTASQIATTS